MANCLYNGTELPELPEWDRDKYPYAVIYDFRRDGEYFLLAMNAPLCWLPPQYLRNATGAVLKYACWWWEDGEAEWNRTETGEYTLGAGNSLVSAYPLWADYNLLYEDGTLYLPKGNGDEDMPTAYVGDADGLARQVTKIYIGDADGRARAARKAYVGNEDGYAVCCWSHSGGTV